MKKILFFILCVALYACTTDSVKMNVNEHGTEWKWNGGTIVVNSPEREAGQKSVLGLTVPKMEVVRVGFVGIMSLLVISIHRTERGSTSPISSVILEEADC